MILKGLYTALVTPLTNDKINIDDFKRLLETQINGGVDGVVVCGTTGESPVLSNDEFQLLVNTTVQYVNGKIKVFSGVGSCDTKKAVEKTKLSHELGVDGVLAVTPYYNKPTQSGLLEYYGKIANTTDKPIILYSIPSRASIEISIDTVAKLHAKHENIVAIKEATENCSRVEIMSSTIGENFVVFSGNDSMTLPFMSVGAVGVISVMSNIMPREMASFVRLAYAGDFHGALRLYRSMMPIMSKLFIETNPLPAKFLLKKKGIIKSDESRSPLGRISKKSIDELSHLI